MKLQQIIKEEVRRALTESSKVIGHKVDTSDPQMHRVTLEFPGGRTLLITQAKGSSGKKAFDLIVNQLKNYDTKSDSKKFIDDLVDKNKVRIQ